MNTWYRGEIEGVPVDLFVSDDYSVQWFIEQEHWDGADPEIIEVCERIEERSKAIRSWSGLNRMLAEEGWSNA